MPLHSKILCALLIVAVIGRVLPAEEAKRSARWDNYIESLKLAVDAEQALRNTRDLTEQAANTPCGWQNDVTECSRINFNEADRLNRRAGNGSLVPPQDQGRCGSCWAFATVNALTDQLSIRNEREQPLLSTRYLTTCNKNSDLVGRGNGCCGARVLHAGVEFIKDNGIVTNSCSIYGESLRTYSRQAKKTRPLPSCPSTCQNGRLVNPLTYSLLGHEVLRSDEQIRAALDEGNVVIAGMVTSDEFKSCYQCGIYCESETSKAIRARKSKQSGHAVVIVDYGTQSGIDFWVVKNSWGDSMHENGYFRIRRGELGIGKGGWAIKLIISGSGKPLSTPVEFSSCFVDTVSDPEDYESIMSAIEFILEELVREGVVSPCADNSEVSQLTLDSITNSSIQQVAGTSIGVSLIANTPCREGDQFVKARINADVFIDLNGSFFLRNGTEYATFLASGSESLSSYITLSAILSILLAIISGCTQCQT